MVYSWDGKETQSYRLYVEEKKSLDEVMDYWEQRGFTPSKRAFQTQFKRWNFPSKQNPAHKNPALIARVKELWEVNTMQKGMLTMLQNEGFNINDRELTRLRLKFNLLLRDNSGRLLKRKQSGKHLAQKPSRKKKKTKSIPGNGLIDQLANAILQEGNPSEEDESEEESEASSEGGEPLQEGAQASPETLTAPLDPEEALRRQLRLQEFQLESAEKWRNRKRRRRTRGWASLPADAPGEPPRFPSETTIDESKAYLGLDNSLYRQMREQFQAICQQEGVVKKTIAGPQKWGQIKERLVRDNTHLSNVFQKEPEARHQNGSMTTPSNFKALSLDVICMDVTKRMRTIDTRMGIPEAKSILGLNPEQTRHVRSAFTERLRIDHFTNKLEAGDQHWNELKQAWIRESAPLSQALAASENDPRYDEKLKAIEVLARDVMKRLRDGRVQKGLTRKKQHNLGPGPGPAPPVVFPQTANVHHLARETASQSVADQTDTGLSALSDASALQIDPSLLLAASNPSMINQGSHGSHQQSQPQQDHGSYMLHPQFFSGAPLPIYFRLHSHSSTTLPGKTVWLGILQAATMTEIRTLAMREHPGTVVIRIEGLVVHKMQGQSDREALIGIDDEDELAAYLQHVAGGKATFVVLLALAQGNSFM